MSEGETHTPVYLSASELLNFSIFRTEAEHFKDVDMRTAREVLMALQAAGFRPQSRKQHMQEFFDAGYVQDWKGEDSHYNIDVPPVSNIL